MKRAAFVTLCAVTVAGAGEDRPGSSTECEVVRMRADGRVVRSRAPASAFAQADGNSARASASSHGSASSSASVSSSSSSSSAGGRSSAEAVSSYSDEAGRTVTIRHDRTGCRIVIDERTIEPGE